MLHTGERPGGKLGGWDGRLNVCAGGGGGGGASYR